MIGLWITEGLKSSQFKTLSYYGFSVSFALFSVIVNDFMENPEINT